MVANLVADPYSPIASLSLAGVGWSSNIFFDSLAEVVMSRTLILLFIGDLLSPFLEQYQRPMFFRDQFSLVRSHPV